MKEEEIKISRRSMWSSIQRIVGLVLVILGLLLLFLVDSMYERFTAGTIVFIGIQSLFISFLIDVFTDVRWYLSKINESSELTNNYLDHQYRLSENEN
tara:strand:+ start:269 stop:562 length:294 start_codon:yes stop_codon:yes gene_type:complete